MGYGHFHIPPGNGLHDLPPGGIFRCFPPRNDLLFLPLALGEGEGSFPHFDLRLPIFHSPVVESCCLPLPLWGGGTSSLLKRDPRNAGESASNAVSSKSSRIPWWRARISLHGRTSLRPCSSISHPRYRAARQPTRRGVGHRHGESRGNSSCGERMSAELHVREAAPAARSPMRAFNGRARPRTFTRPFSSGRGYSARRATFAEQWDHKPSCSLPDGRSRREWWRRPDRRRLRGRHAAVVSFACNR